MFFSISPGPDCRFPNQHKSTIGYFNCDNGWSKKIINDNIVFFKGYVEGNVDTILNSLVNNPTPQYCGNFCVVIFYQHSCSITHDIHRGFPMYYYNSEKMATNLLLDESTVPTVINSDALVSLDQNLYMQNKHFDCIGFVDSTVLTFEQIIPLLIQRLINKTNSVNFGDSPIKLFLSGGIDTATVATLLSSCQNVRYDHIKYEHFDYDYFVYKNIKKIREHHWGYKTQIHHWTNPTVLASGACGDEFFMRGPTTAAMWASWHGIDILKLVAGAKNQNYMKLSFTTPKNKEIFQKALYNRSRLLELYPTINDLNLAILNIHVNDYQHWHIGNTVMFTPFKDLEICKLILQLPTDTILDQMLNATINKALIKALNPQWLKYVGQYKMTNSWATLAELELADLRC